MEPKKLSIHDYLSAGRTTERARFNFCVPDSVEDDLTACYRDVVERFGCQFAPVPDTRRVLKSAARWLREGKPGLLLTGAVGTGKSKLLLAISALIAYYTNGRQYAKTLSATAICELSRSVSENDITTFTRLKSFLYLGIDDLGTEPVTVKSWGTELSPVIDTLYARYDRRMVTVITSNLPLTADEGVRSIKSDYGVRIYDRLCEQYDRITFNFKSFRQ